MRADALLLEHSVEANVAPAFAWKMRTDVTNWNDPPAKFALEGPFAAGSRGTTRIPGQEPLHWLIRGVVPGKSFVIEIQLDRATLSFEWLFDEVSEDKTQLTQRIRLSGDNASAYVTQVEEAFGPTLAEGTQRVADELIAAGRVAHGQPDSGYEAILRRIQKTAKGRRP